jgi:hypothetical protein
MPRRNRGRFVAVLMLASFITVQSSVICALDCLKHGHVAVTMSGSHHHGQACHDGPRLRNEPLNSGPLAEILPAGWLPSLPVAPLFALVTGPASLAEPQHVVRAEPPPPRPV